MARIEETQADLFSSMEASFVEEQEQINDYSFFDYPNRLKPRDIYEESGEGAMYMGKPVLGEVREQEFTDDATGRTTKRIRCSFWLVDDDAEEYLEINLNPKVNDDLQRNIHPKSMLYKLIAGVMETIQRGWAEEHNYINQFDLSELREYLAKKESMTIQLREESFLKNGETITFYPFKVTSIE